MTGERKAPWPERLAEAEARLADEAAKPKPPEPEDLERADINAALVGRTITSVVTEQCDSWDDDLKAVYLTLDDGSVVSLTSRMSLDEGWLGITRTPPG